MELSIRNQLDNHIRRLFGRCVVCPDIPQDLSCPPCKTGEVCTQKPPTCYNCVTLVCLPLSQSLTLSSNNQESPTLPVLHVPSVIGGVVGGICGISLILLLVWKLRRRKSRLPSQHQSGRRNLPKSSQIVSTALTNSRGGNNLEKQQLSGTVLNTSAITNSRSTLRNGTTSNVFSHYDDGIRGSTHTVESLASTALTRASNVIQIAYFPGVSNRTGSTNARISGSGSAAAPSNCGTPTPGDTLSPLASPSFPASANVNNPSDSPPCDLHFLPGEIRDSSYSGLSTDSWDVCGANVTVGSVATANSRRGSLARNTRGRMISVSSTAYASTVRSKIHTGNGQSYSTSSLSATWSPPVGYSDIQSTHILPPRLQVHPVNAHHDSLHIGNVVARLGRFDDPIINSPASVKTIASYGRPISLTIKRRGKKPGHDSTLKLEGESNRRITLPDKPASTTTSSVALTVNPSPSSPPTPSTNHNILVHYPDLQSSFPSAIRTTEHCSDNVDAGTSVAEPASSSPSLQAKFPFVKPVESAAGSPDSSSTERATAPSQHHVSTADANADTYESPFGDEHCVE